MNIRDISSRAILLTALILGNSSVSQANAVGNDAQNFNSITSGLDFVTVQSSETLKPGLVNLGLFLNYAVNTLPYFEAAPIDRRNFNDKLLSADFNLGIGLLENWDAGISLPFVLNQSITNDSTYHGEFSKPGNTEVRLNTKYRLAGDDSKGVALVGSVNFDRLKDNPYTGSGSGPTYNLEVAGDMTFGKVAVGLNLGHRWRNPGTQLAGVPIQPFRNQIIYSVAANYLLPSYDTKLIAEIFGGQPSQTVATDITRSQSSLEALVGMKHDITTQLAFHAGVGTELANAISSPDWRIYTGLNYTWGPIFRKSAPTLEPVAVPDAPKEEVFISRSILFEFDSDNLDQASMATLKELADILKSGFKSLDISGHTDSVGKDEYNKSLSQRRTNAIKKALSEKFGIEASRITTQGYGESEPIADNGNFQGRQLNRRVEFKIKR